MKNVCKKLTTVLLAAIMVVGTALMQSDVAEAAIGPWSVPLSQNVTISVSVQGLDDVELTFIPNTTKPRVVGFHKTNATGFVTLRCDVPDWVEQKYAVTYDWYNYSSETPFNETSDTLTIFGTNQQIQDYNIMCSIDVSDKGNEGNAQYSLNSSNNNTVTFQIANEKAKSTYPDFTVTNDTEAASILNLQGATTKSAGTYSMYRLKNPTTGEHLYTASAAEAANIKAAGWIDETPAGGAWKAPTTSSAPIYRLYNPNQKTCNHLYSMNQTEMASLTKAGWKVEGVAYYSDTNKGVPVYREYNKKTGDHNYTTNLAEHNQLAAQGWTAEGVAWYGVK